jgi:hypothetical protein
MTNELARPVLAEVEQLYETHYENLRDIALSSGGLWFQDAERLAEGLVKRLSDFEGPPTDAAFVQWASEIIQSAARHLEFFYELYGKYRRSVSSGIWSILAKNKDLSHYDDINCTAADLESRAWSWIFFHLNVLAVAGTASLGTRLYAAARFTALTWRKERLRAREKDSGIDVGRIAVAPDGDLFIANEEEDQSDFGSCVEGADGIAASLNYVFDAESDVRDEEIPSRP